MNSEEAGRKNKKKKVNEKMIGEFKLNEIYQGDAIRLAKKIPDNSIDLIVTSPPYADTVSYGKHVKVFTSKEYVNWFLPFFKEASRFLKNSGSFILNINDRVVKGERQTYALELVLEVLKKTNLKLFDRYIWYKKSALPMPGDKRLNDRVEYIFHFVKNPKKMKANTDRIRIPYKEVSLKRFRNKVHGNDIIKEDGTTVLSQRGSSKAHPKGTKPTTVFRFNTASALRGINHPAPFHPELPGFFIKWLTNRGDIVLDPFMGSGTVALVCKRMRRNYLGFEINKSYIQMAEKRLGKNVDPKQITLNY